MIIVGSTDAHLKNWAFRYPVAREVELAPVYDFHSLTVYDRFRYAPLALSLDGEVMAAHVTVDHFRRLADRSGTDPDDTVEVVGAAVQSLREAWRAGIGQEAVGRFPAPAEHYEHRLASMPVAAA